MKRWVIAVSAASIWSLACTAQEVEEPTELRTLRESWQRAVRQATEPLNRRYVESLEAMKRQFTRDGKLKEALAIDTEINKLKTAEEAAEESNSSKLQIVSAFYGEVGGTRKVETTAILKEAMENREEGIVLNTKFGAAGQDPASAAPKETTITYQRRGEKKTKTFPEGYRLNFRDDLD